MLRVDGSGVLSAIRARASWGRADRNGQVRDAEFSKKSLLLTSTGEKLTYRDLMAAEQSDQIAPRQSITSPRRASSCGAARPATAIARFCT